MPSPASMQPAATGHRLAPSQTRRLRLGCILLSAACCPALMAEPVATDSTALAAFSPDPFALHLATPSMRQEQNSALATTYLLTAADVRSSVPRTAYQPPAGGHAPALRLDTLSRNVQSALTTWLALGEDLRPRLQLYQSEYSRLSLSLSHRLKGVRLKYKYSFW